MTYLDTMKQALEALESSRVLKADYLTLWDYGQAQQKHKATITALRLAIKQTEKQEPVAWLLTGGTDIYLASEFTPDHEHNQNGEWTALYAAPPQFDPGLRDHCKAQPEPKLQRQPLPDWIAYDPATDVLTIHGKRYAAAMFGERGFLSPAGTVLRIEQGASDVVTVSDVPQRQPLTEEEIRSMCKETWVFETVKQWVRRIERAHGIGGEA